MAEWISNNGTLIIAIAGHAAASIWYASKMNTTVQLGFKSLNDNLARIEKDSEKRDEKAQEQSSVMWKRIDEVRDRVTHLEAKS